MINRIVAKLNKAKEENNQCYDMGLFRQAAYACGCVVGLSCALGEMGAQVLIDGSIDGNDGSGRIGEVTVIGLERINVPVLDQPKQETTIPKDLFLCRPLVELGEALKESCPPNDCVIYRNVYEMYCEKLADYKRIVAACPDLADSTTRALEHAIRTDEIQLYDMWKNNIAVNRKREAMRSEKEHKARIDAQARE